MPTARPIIVMTFVTKNENWNAWPKIAVMPMATMIEKMPRMIGTRAAVSAPKTSTSRHRAMGMPIDSPVCRSFLATCWKSWLMLAVPAASTRNEPSLPASSVIASTPSIVSAASNTLPDIWNGMIVTCRSEETREASLLW